MPRPTGRLLTSADGTKIYADAVGNPAKPAVVFIHGFSLSSSAFDAIFDDPKWTESLYLVRYDTRGHGRSGMPSDPAYWESKRLADDFDAIVDAFKLVKPFVLGWSLGGTHIADVLSVHAGEYLSGIIHLAAVPYMASVPLVGSEIALTCLPSLGQTADVVAFQEAAVKFVEALSSNMPWALYTSSLGQVLAQARSVTPFVIMRAQDEAGFLKAGAEGLPLLVLGGDLDLEVSWWAGKPLLEGFTNKKIVELEGAEHMAWLTHSEVMREHIVGFVETVLKIN